VLERELYQGVRSRFTQRPEACQFYVHQGTLTISFGHHAVLATDNVLKLGEEYSSKRTQNYSTGF
jgi:hypothetical protein